MVRVLDPYLPADVQLPALVALGAGVATLAYFLTRSSPSEPPREMRKLPTWRPIIGDLPEFAGNAHRLHEWMAERTVEFKGESWRIHIPGLQNMVVISSPEQVEEVLSTQFANFPRGPQQIGVLVDLFGSSVLSTDGEKWFHQRKTASKFFTARSLRLCTTTSLRRNFARMSDYIDSKMAKHEPVDLNQLLHDFTLQTFAEAGFGAEVDLIGHEEPHPLDALCGTSPAIMRRMRVPGFYWKLERWLNIGSEKTVSSSMAGVRAWLNTVVEQAVDTAMKRKALASSSTAGEDRAKEELKSVVELFLDQTSEEKDGLRPEDLVDFILTFVLTARNTAAVTLVWIYLLLSHHPDVEERLRDELNHKLPNLTHESYLTSDDVAGFVYLEAVIKEVLRLHPTVPALHKQCGVDTVIGDGLHVKKGEIIAIFPYGMARLTSLWGPDAAEFKPERWIDETTGELIKVSSNKFVAFGSGPRICLGIKLAMLELRVTLANLINRYRIHLTEPNDLSHLIGVELMPAHPVMIHATHVHSKAK